MRNIEKAKILIKEAEETQFNTTASRLYLEAISLLLLELVEGKGQQ